MRRLGLALILVVCSLAPAPVRAGGVLLGVAGLAATAGLAVTAAQATRSAEHIDHTHTEYDADRPRAIALQWGTGVAAVTSVGLILGAALRYRAVARRQQQLGAWLDGRGLGLTLTGRF